MGLHGDRCSQKFIESHVLDSNSTKIRKEPKTKQKKKLTNYFL